METNESSPAQPTDYERLQRCFDSVFADITSLLGEKDDEKRDERRELLAPLCVMKRIEWKIQIAWGGPEYGFKLHFDPECREWVDGLFYWADWFKYEERPLSAAELVSVIDAYSMDSVAD